MNLYINKLSDIVQFKIKRGKNVNKRITLAPVEIKTRFMKSISK